MKIYTLGDLHLSFGTNKPMDIFGNRWARHFEKIEENWQRIVADEDVVVLGGDTSWGMDFLGAKEDFAFIHKLKGKKIILKGNHDYWWGTANKMNCFLEEEGFTSISFLHNNAFRFGDTAICGTRGWFIEEGERGGKNEKVFLRELIRLRASLAYGKSLGAQNLVAFLHYPPVYMGYLCEEILEILQEYGVKKCYYGHLHGASQNRAITGIYEGIVYYLTACDYVGFCPLEVVEENN